MSQSYWYIFRIILTLSVPVWMSQSSTATEINSEQNEPMAQITNVSQLRDITPQDWAYETLRSLVERYGCIAGYPNGIFAGNQTLSRYEFAAGLNACITKIEELLQGNVTILKDDLEKLQALGKEFTAELTVLDTRINNLESRVAFVEDNSFSTTTKLRGEVIVAAVADGDPKENLDDDDEPVGDQFTLSNRVRLNFQTSFTGRDSLRIRLQAGNVPELDEDLGTDMARLGFDANSNNEVRLRDLHYLFPVGDQVMVWLGGHSLSFRSLANLHNPILDSSSQGGLSRFNRRNPAVFRNGSEQQGIGANVEFNEVVSLDLGYFAGHGDDQNPGNGLFNGDYTAIGQLNLQPTDNFDFGIAVGYSYAPGSFVNLSGSVGSPLAKRPFDRIPTSAWRFGIQGSWLIGDHLNLSAWGGYVRGINESREDRGQGADIWNWSANIVFLDVGKEDAFFALAGGMPPKATHIDGLSADQDTSYIIELLYAYPVTDNLLITPGAYVVLNPDHDSHNNTIWVALIRTTFKF